MTKDTTLNINDVINLCFKCNELAEVYINFDYNGNRNTLDVRIFTDGQARDEFRNISNASWYICRADNQKDLHWIYDILEELLQRCKKVA